MARLFLVDPLRLPALPNKGHARNIVLFTDSTRLHIILFAQSTIALYVYN